MEFIINIFRTIIANRTARIALLIAPLSIYILIIPAYLNRFKPVFPEKSFRFYEITDLTDQGHSSIEKLVEDADSVTISYKLRPGFAFPYIGFGVDASNNLKLSATGYDYITIRIKSDLPTSFKLNLLTSISNKAKKKASYDGPVSQCYYTTVLNSPIDYETIKIPFSEFTVPEWYLSKTNIKKSLVDNIDLRSLYGVELLTSSLNRLNQSAEFTVTSIKFEKNITKYGIYLTLIVVLIYIIILIVWQLSKTRYAVKTANEIIRIHKKLDLGNEKERNAHKLFEYLSEHYSDPYINVNEVSKELNISAYAIPAIIQKYTELSFRQYLNTLRIDEAKRLLKQSDSKIIDIAYAIGYNTVAHFNKIFKKHEGISPKEYRNKVN